MDVDVKYNLQSLSHDPTLRFSEPSYEDKENPKTDMYHHARQLTYAICYMLYAICYMLYVICYMLYAIFNLGVLFYLQKMFGILFKWSFNSRGLFFFAAPTFFNRQSLIIHSFITSDEY